MHILPRRLGRALAGVSAAAALVAIPMAGQAQAAAPVKLHTWANVDRFLSNVDNFYAFMPFSSPTDTRQQWVMEPFKGKTRIRSVSNVNSCLTAGLSTGSIATVRACDNGNNRQLWTLNSGVLLADNGLRAAVDLDNINQTVRMSNNISSPPPDNENWHTHPA
jgi:hypothetical protein